MNDTSDHRRPALHRVAVLGAGTMGRAIAAHLAGAGLEVRLLDLPTDGDPDRIARESLAQLTKDRPAPLLHPSHARRIRPGNFDDALPELASMDWVVEAVVERLDIKRELLARVAEHLGPDAILSTNTSGIPVAAIAEALPPDVRRRFLGTHFFNPPRYMHLLELIPAPDTDPAVLAGLREVATSRLGKGVVLAKDRPNFIANRIGAYGVLRTVELMVEHGLTVEDVDALTGRLLGRPKSATFRTADMVGLDVLLHVAANVVDGAPDDPELATFQPHELLTKMVDQNLLGTKTGSGFYRKEKGPEGTRILTLDLDSLEYREKRKGRFPELETIKPLETLPQRLRAMAKSDGRGARFAWEVLRDTLRYAASVAGEIADDLDAIDNAMKWGFGWDLGPFETWDALGLARTADRMAEEGRPAPQWVLDRIEAGAESFHGVDAEGRATCLSPVETTPTILRPRPNVLTLEERPEGPREVLRNAGASLWDLGDGVLGLEFHSKMNSLGGDAVAMAATAVARAEEGFDAVVVGNHGTHFSAGANIAMLLFSALEGEWEEIDLMVRQFQRMTMGLRRCVRPVVVAPFSLTLGGGAEVTMHGDVVCASAETYMGLVEVGVGLIPAGGGTKELYLRMLDADPLHDPRRAAQRAFETIGMAKISGSAHEARDLGLLQKSDTIVPNRDHLLFAAKQQALGLARSGYAPTPPRTDIAVGGADTLALLEVGLHNFHEARQISEHDRTIGRKLARILAGGDATGPVDEQHLLDLEREAFLSLCGERKTLERVQHMLKTGKPLRN